jgi:xanthine/CO dehydrogenase XdhC/CoxF family maturation factor
MVDENACAVAHGAGPAPAQTRTLVAVFVSPVADYLIKYGHDLGYHTVLVEPERARIGTTSADTVLTAMPELDEHTDLVVTDHHRMELGPLLRDALTHPTRWIGVMGNPRHPAPHISALTDLGVPSTDIDRVHRPIGLNIGSRTPPEIALATMAGLVADRNGRKGGFDF